MKKRRRGRLLLIFSLLNAVLMLLLTFYWLSLPYSFGDETFLIKWTSLVKKSVFGYDTKPPPEGILFIDISGSKTVRPTNNRFGYTDGNTREVITDRELLCKLMEKAQPYLKDVHLLFFDVFFHDSTRYDSAFAALAAPFGDKLLVVSRISSEGELQKPVFDVPFALANYKTTEDQFLKYPLLMKDTLKTVPLVLLEKLNGATFKKWAGLHWINNKLSLPSPLVDFKIRPVDFEQNTSDLGQSNYEVLDLGYILDADTSWMDEADIAGFFKDRIIMVGDFKTDVHNTPFGETAGIIIIYNTYLTLLEEGNVVSVFWMLFLLLGYGIISYRLFSYQKVNKPRWLVKVFQSRLGKFILNTIDEALLLTLITVFSYFIFNIHINILVLLIYTKTIEYVWKISVPAELREESVIADP